MQPALKKPRLDTLPSDPQANSALLHLPDELEDAIGAFVGLNVLLWHVLCKRSRAVAPRLVRTWRRRHDLIHTTDTELLQLLQLFGRVSFMKNWYMLVEQERVHLEIQSEARIDWSGQHSLDTLVVPEARIFHAALLRARHIWIKGPYANRSVCHRTELDNNVDMWDLFMKGLDFKYTLTTLTFDGTHTSFPALYVHPTLPDTLTTLNVRHCSNMGDLVESFVKEGFAGTLNVTMYPRPSQGTTTSHGQVLYLNQTVDGNAGWTYGYDDYFGSFPNVLSRLTFRVTDNAAELARYCAFPLVKNVYSLPVSPTTAREYVFHDADITLVRGVSLLVHPAQSVTLHGIQDDAWPELMRLSRHAPFRLVIVVKDTSRWLHVLLFQPWVALHLSYRQEGVTVVVPGTPRFRHRRLQVVHCLDEDPATLSCLSRSTYVPVLRQLSPASRAELVAVDPLARALLSNDITDTAFLGLRAHATALQRPVAFGTVEEEAAWMWATAGLTDQDDVLFDMLRFASIVNMALVCGGYMRMARAWGRTEWWSKHAKALCELLLDQSRPITAKFGGVPYVVTHAKWNDVTVPLMERVPSGVLTYTLSLAVFDKDLVCSVRGNGHDRDWIHILH